MKRLAILLLAAVLLCGCGLNNDKIKGDECAFLTDAKWEGNDTQCVNVITFKDDGSFTNWCYCGSPVGNGDITESFSYHAEDRSVRLYDGQGRLEETGKILYVDQSYLVIDLWTRVYVYENLNAYRPRVTLGALELTGTEEMTKPCLTVLDFDGKMLTVSAYNYDKDAAASFQVWQLPAAEDIRFSNVSVTIDKGVESIESGTLSDGEIEHIGEFYTSGFFEIDRDGKVQSVVFYGELIIN
ncbi:MAG: hypothetical protein IJF14_01695 [Clostridia bacterium]|nr:hypothetical protein [Clostridia bacterium]